MAHVIHVSVSVADFYTIFLGQPTVKTSLVNVTGMTKVLVFDFNSTLSCGPRTLKVTVKDDPFPTESTTESIHYSKSNRDITFLKYQTHAYLASLSASFSLIQMSTERIYATGSPVNAYSPEGVGNKTKVNDQINLSFTGTNLILGPLDNSSLLVTAAHSNRVANRDDTGLFSNTTEVSLIASFACLTALLIAVVVGCLYAHQWCKKCKYIC